MKRIIYFVIIILLFNISCINSKDYYNKNYKFGFNFRKKYCTFYSPDLKLLDEENKKYNISVTISKIDDLPEDSRSGNVKKEFLNKKSLLEKGKFNFENIDLGESINMQPLIKKSNKTNFVYYIYFIHSGDWTEKKYISEVEGNIFFFKNDNFIKINIKCLKVLFPRDIKDKSDTTYNKYFGPFKEQYGAEFKNDNSAEELYKDIVNDNKELPEDLLLWYKCFKEITDTLVID